MPPDSDERLYADVFEASPERSTTRRLDGFSTPTRRPAPQRLRQRPHERGGTRRHGRTDESGVPVAVTSTVDEETGTVRIVDDDPAIDPSVRARRFGRGGKGSDPTGTGFERYFVDAMIGSYGSRRATPTERRSSSGFPHPNNHGAFQKSFA